MRATEVMKVVLLVVVLVAFACGTYAAVKTPRPQARPNVDQGVKPSWWERPPGEVPTVRGVVENVSATSIAVKNPQGVKSFVVNEKTRVQVRGQKATIADVKVGDPVMVRFIVDPNKVAIAAGVVVPKPSFAGEIKAVQGDVVVLVDRQNVERRVTLTSQTQIHSRGYVGTVVDLRIGYKAMASGTIDGNQMTAEAVSFVPTVAKGTVVAVNGDVISVKTVRQQTIACKASSATAVMVRPRVGPNKKGTLSDITVGVPVDIGFHASDAGPAALLWVDVLTGM